MAITPNTTEKKMIQIKDQSQPSGSRYVYVYGVNPETGTIHVGFYENGGHHSRDIKITDLVVESIEDARANIEGWDGKEAWPRPVSKVLEEALKGS